MVYDPTDQPIDTYKGTCPSLNRGQGINITSLVEMIMMLIGHNDSGSAFPVFKVKT